MQGCTTRVFSQRTRWTNRGGEAGLDGLLRLLVVKLEQQRELRSLDNRWVELADVQGELHDLRAALAVERRRRDAADSVGVAAASITVRTQHREAVWTENPGLEKAS